MEFCLRGVKKLRAKGGNHDPVSDPLFPRPVIARLISGSRVWGRAFPRFLLPSEIYCIPGGMVSRGNYFPGLPYLSDTCWVVPPLVLRPDVIFGSHN